ncbi:MAG: NAD-dependent epimerase/dehydratase family protein [Paraglaciecola chathamensis]
MKITIYGGGWLGQPLATRLSSNEFRGKNEGTSVEVRVTSRSEERLNRLKKDGINALAFTLGQSLAEHANKAALLDNDLVIINIPPGRKNLANNPQASAEFVRNMCELIHSTSIEHKAKIVFISTSAVYGNVQGEITELSPLNPATESAHAHQAIEEYICQNISQTACILRLAGLVGVDRHPGKFLAGKQGLAAGSQKINLVHQRDVINAIEKIILNDAWGETLLLSSTEHPTRKAYYSWAAKQLNLTPPTFSAEDQEQPSKHLNPEYTLRKLSLSLAYPSPYDML